MYSGSLKRDSKLAVTTVESVYLFNMELDLRDKSPQISAKDGSPLPKNPLQDGRVREAIDLAARLGVDAVIVADVYAAGEQPIDGVSKDSLVTGLQEHGHRHALPLAEAKALPELVNAIARPGDMVVCLGAGNITQWAHALPGELS